MKTQLGDDSFLLFLVDLLSDPIYKEQIKMEFSFVNDDFYWYQISNPYLFGERYLFIDDNKEKDVWCDNSLLVDLFNSALTERGISFRAESKQAVDHFLRHTDNLWGKFVYFKAEFVSNPFGQFPNGIDWDFENEDEDEIREEDQKTID